MAYSTMTQLFVRESNKRPPAFRSRYPSSGRVDARVDVRMAFAFSPIGQTAQSALFGRYFPQSCTREAIARRLRGMERPRRGVDFVGFRERIRTTVSSSSSSSSYVRRLCRCRAGSARVGTEGRARPNGPRIREGLWSARARW